MSDSPELLKPNAEVTDSELQIELGNLERENEKLKADYAALLESSTAVKASREKQIAELRSELAAEKTRSEQLWEELEDSEKALVAAQSELSDLKQKSAAARDSVEKAPKILSLIKPWLSPKSPKNLLSKLEEVLEDD